VAAQLIPVPMRWEFGGLRSNRIISPMSEQPLVGVVMGSKSDYEVLSAAVEILRELKIPHEARVVSAHRTPDLLFEYAESARGRGLRVIIAGAGGAAHLPKGIPVGTLAIGRSGAANAALLAAEVLAVSDAALYERLAGWRAARTAEVLGQTLDTAPDERLAR
jgi:5-(carboxyamino)imidazole ribonucleotide mutase